MISFPGSSLRVRVVLLVMLAVIPLLGFMVYGAFEEHAIEVAHHLEDTLKLAHFLSSDHDRLINRAHQSLSALSRWPEVQGLSIEETAELLASHLREFPLFENLVLIDLGGNVLSSAAPVRSPMSVAGASWFQSALESHDFFVQGYSAGSISNPPMVSFGHPVCDRANHLKAIILASFNLQQWLSEVFDRIPFYPEAAVSLVDRHGTILAHRFGSQRKQESSILPQEMLSQLAGRENGVIETSGSDGSSQQVYGFSRLPHARDDVFLLVGFPRSILLGHADRAMMRNGLMMILATGMMLTVALLSADMVLLRRIRLMISAAKRLAEGDMKARTGLRYGRSELSQLAQTFDRMADSLERRQIEAEQLEEVLRESGRRFRAIFNQAFQHTAVLEPDGTLIEANQTILDFGGIRNADVYGKPLWEAPWWRSSDDAPQRLREAITEAARGQLMRFEVEMYGAEGRIATVDFSLKPLKDESGRVTCLIAEGRDVTERKEAELALRESENRYRGIVEDQTELIARFFPDRTLTFANHAFCRYFGRTCEEIMEHRINTVLQISSHHEFWHRLEAMSPDAPVLDLEHRIVMPETGERWLRWTHRAFFDEAARPVEYQAVGWDITDRKQAEETLRESEKELRSLSSKLLTAQEDERKRIARELHDSIGQLLSAVKFGIEKCVQQFHEKSHCPDRYSLEALLPIVQRAIDEVRKIMTDLRPSILDDLGILATLGWHCREYQKVYSMIHVEREIEAQEHEIPEPLKIVIFRIVQEAMNNIAKHSKASFVTVALTKNGDRLELLVEDDGEGFDIQSVLAREDYRNGYGLSSMRERAELSGAVFSIASIRGEGTTIRVFWQ